MTEAGELAADDGVRECRYRAAWEFQLALKDALLFLTGRPKHFYGADRCQTKLLQQQDVYRGEGRSRIDERRALLCAWQWLLRLCKQDCPFVRYGDLDL